MKLEVLFFGRLSEIAGVERMATQVAETSTCEDLRAQLTSDLPQLQKALFAPHTLVAINQTIANWNTPLHANDEVAFLPPVTGG